VEVVKPGAAVSSGAPPDTSLVPRVKLSPVEIPRPEDFAPEDALEIEGPLNRNKWDQIRALEEAASRVPTTSPSTGPRGADGRPGPKGEAGPGKDGGRGPGDGPGKGPGQGTGRHQLTQRQKRMMRWLMTFNTSSGPNYLDQLRGLGAMLAVPVTEGARPRYKLLADLMPGKARPVQADVYQLNRIFWVENNPKNVADIMRALGLPYMPGSAGQPGRPSHFVAFMPPELEDKLARLEQAYRGLPEDRIFETKFAVGHTAAGYEPAVIEQTPKSAALP